MLREVLTVSALILAVLLVRAIFKNRVPKRNFYHQSFLPPDRNNFFLHNQMDKR